MFFNVGNHAKNRRLTPFTLPVVCLCCFFSGVMFDVMNAPENGKQKKNSNMEASENVTPVTLLYLLLQSLSNSTLTDA